jgi:LDH2 family malate/lactate/ureidoglycolate dehydrogenase
MSSPGLIAKQRNSIVYRASHTSHEVIAPEETFSTCYGLNPLSFAIRTVRFDPRELDWAGETSLTRFVSP